MTTEKTKPERTPAEVWDALAIRTTRSILAPNGFKRIHNGKREVSTLQFLGKQTVNEASVVGANMVRLYRENVKGALEEKLKGINELRDVIEKNIKDCRFWQFKRKQRFLRERAHYFGQVILLAGVINDLDNIKPTAPKATIKKNQPK